jgi:uracil-DNA glycosylase
MQTYNEALQKIKQGPWHEFLATQSDLDAIVEQIDNEALSKTIFPNPDDVFRVFETRPEDIKVVILGQDPYYNIGQANGLAFSADDNVAIPRSLKNIFKELESDLGIVRTNPNLTDWHKQGVFLLNTALTVPEKEPNAHKKLWMRFTDDLLDYLIEVNPDVLYIMWGENAIKHGLRIEPKLKRSDLILYSSHPSPLSARHSFFGSKPFSWVNYQLRCQRKTPIDWA